MDQNYIGNTNQKSGLTKHLFKDFQKAYFHFKSRLEASRNCHYSFYVGIEGAFPYICEGEGRSHINNEDIKMLYDRCNQMLDALKSMDLDDSDKNMVDVVVKTGNYLVMVLDFTTHETRLRELEESQSSKRSRLEFTGEGLLSRINAL